MNNNREKKEEIKKALDNQLYDLIDEIDVEEQTIDGDTQTMANILEGYMTEVEDDFEPTIFERPIDDLEIVNQEEIDLNIDETEMIKDYDQNLQKMGDTTYNMMGIKDPQLIADMEEELNQAQNQTNQVISDGVIDIELTSTQEMPMASMPTVNLLDQEVVDSVVDDQEPQEEENNGDDQEHIELKTVKLDQVINQEAETSNTEEFTQVLTSPEIIKIDDEDISDTLDQEVNEANAIKKDLTSPTQNLEVIDQEEETDESFNLENESNQMFDPDLEKTNTIDQEQLGKTIDLDVFSTQAMDEFEQALQKSKQQAPTQESEEETKTTKKAKFNWFDVLLVIVIIVLVFVLVKMIFA